MSSLHQKGIKEIAELLQSKQISSVELNQHFMDRIKQHDSHIHSFLTLTEEQNKAAALASDQRRSQNKAKGILDGIPVAHKDLFCTKDTKTTAASKILENFIPPYSATIVENLSQAGTAILGKLSMDEFAMGSSNEHSAFGNVYNPWHTDYVPGGSSGGSAAAVAARLTPFATGSDTGGSIRQPAAYCGITGIKPTYGTCSRWGMISFASSLDQAGPLAKTAEDCAIILNHMASFDEKDSTSSQNTTTQFDATLEQPLQNITIGVPNSYFKNLNEAMKTEIENAIKTYEKLGANIKPIDLGNSDIAIATYYLIACAEASSNLERYDGVRYGYRCKNPEDLHDLYCRSRSEGFGAEVKRRIMIGSYALSAGYYDAFYEQARRGRRAILNSFQEAFKQCDIILGPTTPSPAFKLGSKSEDPATMYLEDLYTVSVNLAGLPAISHPAGFINGLPVGCQLIGPHFSEARLLNAVHLFQKETDYHQKVPEQFKD